MQLTFRKNTVITVAAGVLLVSVLALALVTSNVQPSVIGVSTPRFTTVKPAEFAQEVAETGAVIIDIRTAAEYDTGKLSGAISIDYYKTDFRAQLAKLDKSKPYKLYCNSGNRSASAVAIMRDLGFSDVTELAGGIQAWKQQGFPIV
jgi:rhodanese-related sulfurtransferase